MIEFQTSCIPIDYPQAMKEMSNYVDDLAQGKVNEKVWFLEHPSIYTMGITGKMSDILNQTSLPLYSTGRGGQVTYHGPGQRIAYIMLNLAERFQDVRKYVWLLEEWLILTLRHLGIYGERREGRIGIWIKKKNDPQDYKIAALGIRIRKWITFHGIAINVNPDLSYYQNIIACGLSEFGVTSLYDLGCHISLQDVDNLLIRQFKFLFKI